MPVPYSACSRTRTGGTTGVKPSARMRSTTKRIRASSTMTRSPSRYANREPDAAAAFSMSIQPCSRPRSRWSRTSKSNVGRSPTSRSVTASSSPPSGASGCGRLGSVAASSSRRVSTSASSPSRRLISPPSSRISPIRASASSPERFAAAISSETSLRRARPSSTRGSSSRRRASSASSSSRDSAAPRRASAARAASGSSRMRFRSSIGCRARCLAAYSEGRSGRSISSPELSATNCATASASSPTTMFCGMIAPENPPLRIA